MELRAHYGRHPQTRQWMSPLRRALGPGTPAGTESAVAGARGLHSRRNRLVRARRQDGHQVGHADRHLHHSQTGAKGGRKAQAQTQAREEQLLDPARQAPGASPAAQRPGPV
ncbi:MAG: hypothetical protein M0C28_15930 [Candidatus Moduliflexus flocculans]|nr:hypothetical protein [Candidatus Moduliflexus flocculans]